MASLFTLLGGSKQSPTRPAWLSDRIASALSVQLMRPGGILGLLNVLLGRSGSGRLSTIEASSSETSVAQNCKLRSLSK